NGGRGRSQRTSKTPIPMATQKRYPVKLVGTTSWTGGPDDDIITAVPVKRSLLRSDSEIVLDCQCDSNNCAVSLKSNDKVQFEGEFAGRDGSKEWPVSVQAKLYSNPNGYFSKVRPNLTPADGDKFVAIDIETGEYESGI